MRETHGLVFGKFLPPHAGHFHLFDEAARYSDKLTIVLCSLPTDPIDPRKRLAWIQELRPEYELKHCDLELPSYPDEDPDFWQIWRDTLRYFCPDATHLFTSASYGERVAKEMGMEHVCIDRERTTYPVSGRELRERPGDMWEMAPGRVKDYLRKHVSIIGPESTGKSTLARELARSFKTGYTPEYGREYTSLEEVRGRRIEPDDFVKIAREHRRLEALEEGNSRHIHFSDTDALATALWAEQYVGLVPQEVWRIHHDTHKHLRLLCAPDISWIQDGTRVFGEDADRQRYFERAKQVMDAQGLRYRVVTGTGTARVDVARQAVEEMLEDEARKLENPPDRGREQA